MLGRTERLVSLSHAVTDMYVQRALGTSCAQFGTLPQMQINLNCKIWIYRSTKATVSTVLMIVFIEITLDAPRYTLLRQI